MVKPRTHLTSLKPNYADEQFRELHTSREDFLLNWFFPFLNKQLKHPLSFENPMKKMEILCRQFVYGKYCLADNGIFKRLIVEEIVFTKKIWMPMEKRLEENGFFDIGSSGSG